MTDRATLLALADRIERELPSRELDSAIWEATGGMTKEKEQHCWDWCHRQDGTVLTREMFIEAWAPEFTSSLDAAATLIQEGSFWTILMNSPEYEAAVVPPGAAFATEPFHYYEAPTPAQALCAAALRARAAVVGDGT